MERSDADDRHPAEESREDDETPLQELVVGVPDERADALASENESKSGEADVVPRKRRTAVSLFPSRP